MQSERAFPVINVSTMNVSTNVGSNSAVNASGIKFLDNSKGLDVISLLKKFYLPLEHIKKVIKF